jgi:predicted NodU family carbamoyl transferase
MYILGISAFYHDSAACLVKDGDIFAAAQEERFTRKKHDFNFPTNALKFCLRSAEKGTLQTRCSGQGVGISQSRDICITLPKLR